MTMTMRTTGFPFILLSALMQPAVARASWPPTAFISPPSVVLSPLPKPAMAMHASKSSNSKQKNMPPSNKGKGGGFGSKSSSSPHKSKDIGDIVYPELEPQVIKTLIPAPPRDGTDIEGNGDILSEEMYDRLEEIYGLGKFNFGGTGAIYKSISVINSKFNEDGATRDDGEVSSLFGDILSGGGSSQSAVDELLFSPSSSLPSVGKAATSQIKGFTSSFDLNSISPFEKFRVLHTDPMVLAIDDFFTMNECDKYVQMSIDSESNQQQLNKMVTEEKNNLQPMLLGQSQTVGKDSRSKAQRTSTTWFHYYEGVPELMAKASRLLGLEGIGRWEEPQTVRYRRNEKFTWHLDALSPEDATSEVGAGQRVATLLVYLTDIPTEDGGATMFRDLGGDGPLKV